MLGPEGDIVEDENPISKWYCPETSDSCMLSAPSNKTDTNPKPNCKQFDFKLEMDLFYRDGKGSNLPAVYEGATADGLTHSICLQDGSRIDVHDSNLQLIDQPDFANMP